MSESFLLDNCSQVLTMAGEGLGVVEHGCVRVKEGRIAEVGAGLRPRTDEKVIDCGGCVVLPGFVDPHTHLVFGGWRADEFERRLEGATYRQLAEAGGGILSTVTATRQASEDELYERALARLREMVSWGTTTVEVKSGYGLETETELKMLRVAERLGEAGLAAVVPTFMGAHSVPTGTHKSDYIRLLTGTMLPAVAEQGIARFCDVFCERFVFNVDESIRILDVGRQHGLPATVHADEIESSGGAEVAAKVSAASASHLLQPSSAGLRGMAERGVTAVLLPGTCFMLREQHKPPVAMMRDMGIAMAVATDFNPGSCTLLCQPLALQLACIHYGLTIEEALRGVTVVAARALRVDPEVGTLEPGRQADIVVTDVPEYRHLAYRLGHNPVRQVFKAGRVIHAVPA